MKKANYMKMMAKKPDEAKLTDADIKAWLDEIAESFKRLKESEYPLEWGKRNEEGVYEKEIDLVGSAYGARLHIYRGIEHIAKAVKKKIQVTDDHTDKYPFTYYFTYKGVYVFELRQEESEK